MNRSIPTDNSLGSASGHAFQTIVGNVGWPLSWNAPSFVEAATLPVRGGVVSRNDWVAVRPSAARAVTQTFHELAAVRPETSATCSTSAGPSGVHSVGVAVP
jgi:hypothetical protein